MLTPRRLPAVLLSILILFHPCGGALSAVQADAPNLPDLGDESAAIMSPLQERKIGEEFMRMARRELNILDDPELNQYLSKLGQRLLAKSGVATGDFVFFIVDSPEVNAFAFPPRYIGVHTGLILAAHNEAELASVLAHETAHITQRHRLRMIAEAKRTTGPAVAALLAAILLAGSGSRGGEAAIALTTASVAQKELNYTRAFEEEADRIGMQILAAAGFDARAMPAFFERLQASTRLYETNLPEFLRTHPITTRRISESRDRADTYPLRPQPMMRDFYHAQAKIRALAPTSPAEIVKGFRSTLASRSYADRDAEHYGYAWALVRDNQIDAARDEIRGLLRQRPGWLPYQIAEAEIEFAAGHHEQARAVYAAAFKANPSDRALIQRYATALLKTGRPAQARDLLKNAVRQRPEDPVLYKLLATAAGESGALLEAHQALAEHHYLNGNPNTAIQQLQIAMRFAGDNFYALASLEARLKEIKDEVALFQAN